MTLQPPEEEAPPAVAVARTAGGVVLVIVGLALGLFGAFWFFIVPWFGWAMEGFWSHLAEWADVGGAVVGIGGFIVLVLGGGLIQRARKKRFEAFPVVSLGGDEEPPTGGTPPTVVL